MEYKIREIKKKCDEILAFEMWFNFDESFFWPIVELIDVDSNFLINLYNSIDDKYFEILNHESVIVPVVESIQSIKFYEYIKSIRNKQSNLVDDILVHDIESALFINYEEPDNYVQAEKFNIIYMSLKKLIKKALGENQNQAEVKRTLDKVIDFSEKNAHEYLSFVRVYWLSLYFNRANQKFEDQIDMKYYKKHLSMIFPSAYI